jgi:hypothetical protein
MALADAISTIDHSDADSPESTWTDFFDSAPEEIRTPNLLIRSQRVTRPAVP